MAIVNPLKVIITNYPSEDIEYVEAINNMENESLGTHKMALVKYFILKKKIFVKLNLINIGNVLQKMLKCD